MVMLGVATLIVVNSVMAGFSEILREHLNDKLWDIVIEASAPREFTDTDERIKRVLAEPSLSQCIAGITAVLECPATMEFITTPDADVNETNEKLSRTCCVRIAGIDLHASPRYERLQGPAPCGAINSAQARGIIVGTSRERGAPQLGEPILLVTTGQRRQPVFERFVVVDFHENQTAEDYETVFIDINDLERLRGTTNRATAIKIKLKNYARDNRLVIEELSRMFPGLASCIRSWEEVQGPLLQAITMERNILNVLVFLIVAVAGCGVLTLFSMMVNEKKCDIGILRAMGASAASVFQMFLAYGFLLGIIGAICGVVLGLGIVRNINELERALSGLTGDALNPAADRQLYFWRHYFNEIPTSVDVLSVSAISCSAVVTALLSSLIPAWRAASMPPARSLRAE